jgi:AcrR family transcriptional regulator
MARTVNEAAHAERRSAFLDTAQRLIGTKGYEQMTIQDVLNDLGASKGALYHYFDSKQALLEGIVERYAEAMEAHLARCAADPDLTAIQKLRGFFTGLRPNAAEVRLSVAAVPTWYSDDNAAARHRLRVRLTDRSVPLLTQIVKQGVAEGVFATEFADWAGQIAIDLILDVDETTGRQMLAVAPEGLDAASIERMTAAYTDALERVLGAPAGSLVLIDPAALQTWLDVTNDAQSDGAA